MENNKMAGIKFVKQEEINSNGGNVSGKFDGLKEEEFDEDVTPELIEELERLRKKDDFVEIKDLKKHLGV